MSVTAFTSLAFASPVDDAGQFVFFQAINDFIRYEIDVFQWNLLQHITLQIGGVAMILLSIWIMFQGYRIVTGRSREPMMALVSDSLRNMLLIGLATSMAAGSSQLYWSLTDGVSSAIVHTVSGNGTDAFQSIDNSLAKLSVALGLIDTLDTGGDSALDSAKTQAKWFSGIGIAGPGVIAGILLLVNKAAMAMFIGFGPLFILCLMFKPTQSLFQRWLLYGIGTVFSLGVLSVMAGIATRLIIAAANAYLTQYIAATQFGIGQFDGISAVSLQQGGVGLVLCGLLLMIPPIAATFFQGTLANFMTYSPFGQIGANSGGHAGPPGSAGYQAPPRTLTSDHRDSTNQPTTIPTNHTRLHSQAGVHEKTVDQIKKNP